ncbi:hypothetical protein vseg_000115 [Gypsophila vaccaria]
MLDSLFGRSSFYTKCKSLIKQARNRIEVVKRKRDATQKFLRKDVADLLANGLDSNAFARADGLINETILSSCYEFIDHVCEIVLKHLPVLQKLRECPEDCREAVASLMFAAARFSDVPELRDLRDLFQERYGSSLEFYVNQKLVENITTKPPSVEKKIQLLQDIASEFSIMWDSKSFQERMSKSATDQKQQNSPGRLNMAKNKVAPPPAVVTVERTIKDEAMIKNKPSSLRRREHKEGVRDLDNEDAVQSVTSSTGNKLQSFNNENKEVRLRRNHVLERDLPKPDPRPNTNVINSSSPGNDELAGDSHISSMKKQQVDVTDGPKSNFRGGIPPPYMKPRKNKYKTDEANDTLTFNPHSNGAGAEKLPTRADRPDLQGEARKDKHRTDDEANDTLTFNPGSNGNRAAKLPTKADQPDLQNVANVPENGDGVGRFTEIYYKDESTVDSTRRRRSHRRRHARSALTQDDEVIDEERILRRVSTSRRRNGSRKGLQILIADDDHYKKDEEEKMIDKLLLHYSKQPSTGTSGKLRRKTNSSKSPHHDRSSTANATNLKEESTLPKSRSFCLPSRQETEPMQQKVFTRAASFNQDTPAKHVHPKLPDYDDLAARFAALRAAKG